jgi:acyl-coenzyme A synthetase/AMP-(fatty) acid ligase
MTVPNDATTLWELSLQNGLTASLYAPGASLGIADLATGSILGGNLNALAGRSILLATQHQLPTATALIELDGVARRVVLCTPELSPDMLAHVAVTADADGLVTDCAATVQAHVARYLVTPSPAAMTGERHGATTTEWVLLTSGTTGVPKLVVHTLESLAGTLPRRAAPGRRCVWSTFYDIRRYGGLQIYLRALVSGADLVLSSPDESVAEFFTRGSMHGVTHISGTPSHWRRVLMSGAAKLLAPEYVRLSGEVADQALLDALRAAYPDAQVSHAFASTEAGVAFDINDGKAGFPADMLLNPGAVDLKVHAGTLHIRSGRTAARYLGDAPPDIIAVDGYVDTGDLVELRDGRYQFCGRKGGIINVGGLKVYPEEVESVLNADPRIRMSIVRARRNPVTGAIVAADVVLADRVSAANDPEAVAALKKDLIEACRRALPAHKVPATIRFVAQLDMTAAGKLVRPGA